MTASLCCYCAVQMFCQNGVVMEKVRYCTTHKTCNDSDLMTEHKRLKNTTFFLKALIIGGVMIPFSSQKPSSVRYLDSK